MEIFFVCRMVDFCTSSTDSCLLFVLQAEPTRTPFVTSETYMHNETSALILDICIGRETGEVGEVGKIGEVGST